MRDRCEEYCKKEPVCETSPVLQFTDTQGLLKKT